jgi:hypothetical protein
MKKYNKKTDSEVMAIMKLWLCEDDISEKEYTCNVYNGIFHRAKTYWPNIDEHYLIIQSFLAASDWSANHGQGRGIWYTGLEIYNELIK